MRNDNATVAAIAVIAMCVATVAHEAVGHGAACLLAGGRITQLTSVYFQCAVQSRFVSPAGPVGNLIAAALAWLALQALPQSAVRARLLALLTMALSVFWMAGQLTSSAAMGQGDYAIAGYDFLGQPTNWWRACGVVLGIAIYLGSARLVAREAAALSVGPVAPVLRVAWLAAALGAIAAASFYAGDTHAAMWEAFLEIGANSFPLLLIARPPQQGANPNSIARSPAWIVAAILIFLAFAATLGRGVF